MSDKHDDDLDHSRSALLVKQGNTSRRIRPLEGEVILIGSSRCCQIVLASGEIASIHCVVVRGRNGWCVRDCDSRVGIRVNGQPVVEKSLTHGDSLQVGTFIFEMHLPDSIRLRCPPPPPPRQGRALQHLQHARRNLVRLALKLRKRLRQNAAVALQAATPEQAELIRRAELLRHRFRDLDLRAAQLEMSERELARDRAVLEQSQAELKARMEEAECQLAAKQARLEEVMENRRQELASNGSITDTPSPVPVPGPIHAGPIGGIEANCLELRRRELDAWSAYLHQQRRRLREREKDLDCSCAQLRSETHHFREEQKRWNLVKETYEREHEETVQLLDEQRHVLSQELEEIARIREELSQLSPAPACQIS